MFVNLTPHSINVGERSFAPSGQVARVAAVTNVVDSHEGIDIAVTTFGAVEGLPAQAEGVLLIVSAMVRAAAPGRSDLVSPGEQVRDATGRVIGCKNLTR